MRITLSDEQEEFRAVVRRFLEENSPSTEVRRLMETEQGHDHEVWRKLSQDLGLPALHIPEEYGGPGFGYVGLFIVMEEAGRALLCAPLFASVVLAANAILEGASENQKKELLPGIASGQTIATLAFAEADGAWSTSSVTTTAEPEDGAFRLEGEKHYVLDGTSANLIVVVARAPGACERATEISLAPASRRGACASSLPPTGRSRSKRACRRCTRWPRRRRRACGTHRRSRSSSTRSRR